jgi:hypothetical protein
MGHNYEKEFFEQFEGSSKDRPVDPIAELFGTESEHDEFEELGELIVRFQDGVIDPKQFNRLQEWLLSDKKALEYYVDYTWLYAGLNILLNKNHDLTWQQSLLASKA